MSESKDKGGRPAYRPTPDQKLAVSVMAAVGTPQELICEELVRMFPVIGSIHVKTLRKYFKAEIQNCKAIATARMGRSVFFKGMGNGAGSVQAAIFWLKTKGARVDPEWQEIEHIELNDKITRELAEGIDLGIFNDEELAQIRAGKITKELISRISVASRSAAVPGGSGGKAP